VDFCEILEFTARRTHSGPLGTVFIITKPYNTYNTLLIDKLQRLLAMLENTSKIRQNSSFNLSV